MTSPDVPTPASETLPEDVLLALRANVMILLVNRHDTVTSTDVVAEVLRSLDANGYDLVRRPDENAHCATCGGAPESTLHMGLPTAKGHRYEPATNAQQGDS